MSVATDFVSNAESVAGAPMRPLLGGGTRLMLALHHRISDDIDLFIRDPQWIGYLTPRLNDQTESMVDAYEENAVSLKLRLPPGEIDFIVSMALLKLPTEKLPGVAFELESVAEVLAKKLFYRGSLLTPRDLFDWWAINTMATGLVPHEEMARLLKDRLAGIENALEAMSVSTKAREIWEALRAPVKPLMDEAIAFAKVQIEAYRHDSYSPGPSP